GMAAGAPRTTAVPRIAALAGPAARRPGLAAAAALEPAAPWRRPGLPFRRAASLDLAAARPGLALRPGAAADTAAAAGAAGGAARSLAPPPRSCGLALPAGCGRGGDAGLVPAGLLHRQRARELPLAAGGLAAAVLRGAAALVALACRLAAGLPGAGGAGPAGADGIPRRAGQGGRPARAGGFAGLCRQLLRLGGGGGGDTRHAGGTAGADAAGGRQLHARCTAVAVPGPRRCAGARAPAERQAWPCAAARAVAVAGENAAGRAGTAGRRGHGAAGQAAAAGLPRPLRVGGCAGLAAGAECRPRAQALPAVRVAAGRRGRLRAAGHGRSGNTAPGRSPA